MSDEERMVDVDSHPDAHRATEPDEERVLRELYGEPTDGVYYGSSVTGEDIVEVDW